MEAITVAMIVYCLVLALLIFGISFYRGVKRKKQIEAFKKSVANIPAPESGTAAASTSNQSPHDAPPARAA